MLAQFVCILKFSIKPGFSLLPEVSVLIELILGHLRCRLTDVPPQPNSQPDSVFRTGLRPKQLVSKTHSGSGGENNGISKATCGVVVLQACPSSHLCYIS